MTNKYAMLFAMLVWSLSAAIGRAQFGTNSFGVPAPRPSISPYLNLVRGGSPAINYYGLVRPQVAAARAIETLGNEFQSLESTANQPSQTGHRSSFMTQSQYFMNTNVARPGGTPAGGQGFGQPRPATRSR